jgi:HEAT repeat protein
MKNRIIRMVMGVVIGISVVAGGIWLLGQTLGDHPTLYAGKPMGAWELQLNSTDAASTNQANAVLNSQIIPALIDQMFHDTNDSALRLSLVTSLNRIPGIRIRYTAAASRRNSAAGNLGIFGPPAAAAVPSLIQALKGPQFELHEAAIRSLGRIRSNPDTVIPLLIPYLTNDDLNEEVAIALGDYGSQAKEAFPELLPLLHDGDPHIRSAARFALLKIDPEAAAKAHVEPLRKKSR